MRSLSDIIQNGGNFDNNLNRIEVNSQNFVDDNKECLLIVVVALGISVLSKVNVSAKTSLLFSLMAFGVAYNMTKNKNKAAVCSIVTFLVIMYGNPYVNQFFGYNTEPKEDVLDNLDDKANNNNLEHFNPHAQLQQNEYQLDTPNPNTQVLDNPQQSYEQQMAMPNNNLPEQNNNLLNIPSTAPPPNPGNLDNNSQIQSNMEMTNQQMQPPGPNLNQPLGEPTPFETLGDNSVGSSLDEAFQIQNIPTSQP